MHPDGDNRDGFADLFPFCSFEGLAHAIAFSTVWRFLQVQLQVFDELVEVLMQIHLCKNQMKIRDTMRTRVRLKSRCFSLLEPPLIEISDRKPVVSITAVGLAPDGDRAIFAGLDALPHRDLPDEAGFGGIDR